MIVSNTLIIVLAVIGAISLGHWGTKLVNHLTGIRPALQIENDLLRDQITILQEDLDSTKADLDSLRDSSANVQSEMLRKLLETG